MNSKLIEILRNPPMDEIGRSVNWEIVYDKWASQITALFKTELREKMPKHCNGCGWTKEHCQSWNDAISDINQIINNL